ncbi:hypothetical protein HpKG90_01410 [Helicobacter pylori]
MSIKNAKSIFKIKRKELALIKWQFLKKRYFLRGKWHKITPYPFKKIMIKSKTMRQITKTPFFKNIKQDFSRQYAIKTKPNIQQA